MRDGAGRCPAGRVGGEKLRPARQRLAMLSLHHTGTRRNYERSQLHGTRPVTPTGYTYSGHAPSLHSSYARRGPSLASSRASIPAMPSPPAPRHVASSGLAVLRRSLRGCFTASASSACRSLNGRRHTVGVARGRAHVLRQATLSARRRPRERGRTCAVVGPSDSFSDNQNWPVRISSLT
jgi:hypothetical protein